MGSASSQCAAGRLYHRECCWAVAVIATSTRPVNIILFITSDKVTKKQEQNKIKSFIFYAEFK